MLQLVADNTATKEEESPKARLLRRRRERYSAREDARKAALSAQKARYAEDEAYRERKKADAARRHERIKDTEAEKERNRRRYLANREQRIIRARESKLKNTYGITQEDYERMLVAQNGVCAICRKPCRVIGKLSIDHDHATGRVRGLLCATCNHGVGSFYDSAANLRAAADYLERA